MKQQLSDSGFHPIRRDQLRQEREHDSYRQQHKPPEPSACPECGAIFHAGRWQWGAKQQGSTQLLCPACLRIRDEFPAGFVSVGGKFFTANRLELLSLIEHHAAKEKAQHPLARIMAIEEHADGDGGIRITTTDIHLARDLGEALHKAYHGELDFHYNEAEKLLRVHWQR